jgi:HAD superfamily hydrolase (TIGR01549 family)
MLNRSAKNWDMNVLHLSRTWNNRNFELFSRREKPLAITPGIDSVIRELSQLAILTVITGNSCQVVERFLEAYELNGEFQTILGAEDAGRWLEKILKIVSLHGRLNSEVYMIGDAVSDIHTAREAEIKSIAVGWGHQSMEKLIKEIPDFMVSHPGDLLALFTD